MNCETSYTAIKDGIRGGNKKKLLSSLQQCKKACEIEQVLQPTSYLIVSHKPGVYSYGVSGEIDTLLRRKLVNTNTDTKWIRTILQGNYMAHPKAIKYLRKLQATYPTHQFKLTVQYG